MREASGAGRRLFGAAIVIAGCGGERPAAAPPPVFGGQGAVVSAPREMPLPAEDKSKVESGPCAKPSPVGDVALVDDFEDGDAKPFKAFQREGWWFSASDDTQGSKLYPSGAFAPDKLPAPTKANALAAHFKAEGQKQWGVTFGTTLRWVDNGIRCPFNGSSFGGVKFRAKGPGDVRVSFGMPETFPPDSGGTCKQGCWDSHGMVVHLTAQWDEYVVRWDHLQQGGWGAQARFDPARLLGLNFSVGAKELPADFWIDDIEFTAAREAPASASSTAVPTGSVPSAAPEGAKPVKPSPGR